jgi:hypothetical protein
VEKTADTLSYADKLSYAVLSNLFQLFQFFSRLMLHCLERPLCGAMMEINFNILGMRASAYT